MGSSQLRSPNWPGRSRLTPPLALLLPILSIYVVCDGTGVLFTSFITIPRIPRPISESHRTCIKHRYHRSRDQDRGSYSFSRKVKTSRRHSVIIKRYHHAHKVSLQEAEAGSRQWFFDLFAKAFFSVQYRLIEFDQHDCPPRELISRYRMRCHPCRLIKQRVQEIDQ